MNEVDAVKSENQREQIETLLAEKGEIYADVWKFGINTALRISDLLSLTMAQVKVIDLHPDKRQIEIIEQKTGKARLITLNDGAMDIAQKRLAANPKHVWLFQSDSPKNHPKKPQPITRRSVARVFASVGQRTNPTVQLSTHSMRKTRGYAMHSAGASIEEVCNLLNHSHTGITMRYIGLDAERVRQSYHDLVL